MAARRSRRQIEALREHVANESCRGPSTWLSQDEAGAWWGIGGTVRGLAAVAQRAEGLSGNGVQGMTVHRRGAGERSSSDWRRCQPSERASVPGVKPARADLILAGAVVVEGALQAGGFDALEATEAGLREGVFFERHLSDPAHPDAAAAVRKRASGRPGERTSQARYQRGS